jgi:hypothetical protein
MNRVSAILSAGQVARLPHAVRRLRQAGESDHEVSDGSLSATHDDLLCTFLNTALKQAIGWDDD